MGLGNLARVWGTLLVLTWSVFAYQASLASQGTVVLDPPDTALITAARAAVLQSRLSRRLVDMVMPIPADNPLTDSKAALGRRLFFDNVLSIDRSVSCATCHEPDRAFADTRTLAVGVFGRVGKRHAPSLVNRGYGRSQFWDGRSATLEAQVLQPITDKNEMDLSLDEAVARLSVDESYRNSFRTTFGRAVTSEDLGRALASYLRTIRSDNSPFDRFQAGQQDALTPQQQMGFQIFQRQGCSVCHVGANFTDELFQNTGVAWRVEAGSNAGAYQDEGRALVSGNQRDQGKFKTPTLREVALTAPYMHDGSLPTLEAVVDFYDNGGRPNPNIFPVVRPLGLSAEQKQALVAFLQSLSGVVTGK